MATTGYDSKRLSEKKIKIRLKDFNQNVVVTEKSDQMLGVVINISR